MGEVLLLLILTPGDTLRLSLARAEEMALAANPSLLSQAKTASAYAWDARGAYAGYLPQASLQASYSDMGSYGPLPGVDTSRLYSATISVSQPLFSPSGIYGIVSQRAQAGGQKALYERTRLQTLYSVDEAYLGLLKAKKTVLARQKALARARNNFELLKARFQLGDASQADMARAEASLRQAEYDLNAAQSLVSGAESALLLVLGKPPGTPVDVEDVEPEIQWEPGDLDSLKALALKRRQDLLQQKRSLSSLRAGFWYKALSFLPEISLGYYWRYYGTDFPDLSSGLDEFSKSSGIYAQLSFNLTGYPFSVAAERDRVAASEWACMASGLSVQKDVEDAYQALEDASQAYELARKSQEAAAKAYELTEAQFQLGAASQLELADAEASLLNAELSLWSAKYDLILARRKLELAVGGIK